MTQFRGAVDLSALASSPSAPASGYLRTYGKTDGRLYTQDSAGHEAPVSVDGVFGPDDHSLLAWSFDPAITTAGTALTAGTIYLVGMQVRKSANATTIYWCNQSAGSGLTAAQCWAALLDSSGVVLQSADISGQGSSGSRSISITSTPVVPGFYWVAFLFNGTTPPSLARNSTISAGMLNLNRGNLQRYATNGTSQTTITDRTPASNTNLAASIWAALG